VLGGAVGVARDTSPDAKHTGSWSAVRSFLLVVPCSTSSQLDRRRLRLAHEKHEELSGLGGQVIDRVGGGIHKGIAVFKVLPPQFPRSWNYV